MASVTQLVKQAKQPHGGFLPISKFEEIDYFDDATITTDFNIHSSLIGLAVDYGSRRMLGSSIRDVFSIAIRGASMLNSEAANAASQLLKTIQYGIKTPGRLSDEVIIALCQISGFDVCFRAGVKHYKPVEEIAPDAQTIASVRVFIERTLTFFQQQGQVVTDGFTMEGSFTDIADSGDGDYLTEDTVWELKTKRNEPDKNQTLQVLLYYLMGARSKKKEFQGIERIGIFNPVLNKAWIKPVIEIDETILNTVEKDVIGYNMECAPKRKASTGTTVYEVIDWIRDTSENESKKGTKFERAARFFLKNDPLYAPDFEEVWLWKDAPTNDGADIGIDLVAKDTGGEYWAIQCKCYDESSTLNYKDVSTFYSTAGAKDLYAKNMIISTTEHFSSNLDKVARDYATVRLFPSEMAEADIDWDAFIEGRAPKTREIFAAREHQQKAIDACIDKFRTEDRGKLIMACGTGKTLTALRLAEAYCPKGIVLFLAPSISLISQTLRSWANQAKDPLRCAVVCSDAKASSTKEDAWESSLKDIPYPATTDSEELIRQVQKSANLEGLTAIFSTYQSIQVIIDAQKKGLADFDLCVCDEAHRTTGVRDLAESKESESAFTKVHDQNILHAKKRIYMTATPRMYGTTAVKAAHEENYELSSMDDASKYGEEFYRLSFGRAVEMGLLADYRVIVLTVSEEMVSQVYQQTMASEEEGFNIPEAAKILGCWKGLATRGESSSIKELSRVDLADVSKKEDVEIIYPMQRAVAFNSTINESKQMAEIFQQVVDAYVGKTGTDYPLQVETAHIDGSMDSDIRKEKLRWLEEDTGDEVCRILSNVKCLSEGVDVPNLDAVLFMKPRNSQVDIIQSVGRVMRKAPGKQYGYIILPVVVPAGMAPEEALNDDKSFAVVWQILQALRSHDERLDARINSLQFLGAGESGGDEIVTVATMSGSDDDLLSATQEKLALEWTVKDWQNSMQAKLVKKCGTRVYWEDWADDVAGIASRHIKRIQSIISTDSGAKTEFDKFLEGLRDSLNPGVNEQQAIEMLAQHLITLPVFESLFGNASFVKSNPVSIAMEAMLDVLRAHQMENREDDEILESLYNSVRSRVSVVQSSAGRQAIIKELYEGFFSKAFKGTSEKMGIVYTPNEIVDYILHATDRMLKEEFGEGLGSAGVHIVDPFAGTGTFIANLIASDIISDKDLPHKYSQELHSNELLLLAYYIMTINIEQAYHARTGGEYVPFNGAVLTDTFQMSEEGDTLDTEVFTQNSERVAAQNKLDIKVIVGNPPYSIGQKSENDNNQNEAYPSLDKQILEKYANRSNAGLKKSLYDSYIRAIRWASDRVGKTGIICYVSNAGWIDSQSMDGMRKCLVEEFSSIYVYHLRGNQRTQGEESRKEGGKVFGSGSRAPIAITMLVKNSENIEHGKVYVHDIGDYLTREQKLGIVKKAAQHGLDDWIEIQPDRHGDWLNQRDDSFYGFAPLAINKHTKPLGLFSIYSLGVSTNRDPWVYSFSRDALNHRIEEMVTFYNQEVEHYIQSGKGLDVDSVISNDATKISWSSNLKTALKNERRLCYQKQNIRVSSYRPFCKQYLYFNQLLNARPGQQRSLFPEGKTSNFVIQVAGVGSRSFSCLISRQIPCLDTIEKGQCFPLYWYEKQEELGGLFAASSDKYTRHDAITNEALAVFQQCYPNAFTNRAKKDGGAGLSKEDIFYYIYGILHSAEYRTRFESNLKKGLPCIPLAENFDAFSKSGRELAYWHLNYETAEPYPLEEIGNSIDPGRTEKMRFGKCKKDDQHSKGEDQTVLSVAENMTLKGIPLQAYDYIVNGKSAIGWLMDRYRVTTDKASGIVNDPNEYSDDPRYIVDLVKRVVRISMETLEIVGNLPPLNEKPHPADWPFAWEVSR